MEFIMAFLVGGAICAVGQLLLDYTQLTPARILVLFVTAGAVLTALCVEGRQLSSEALAHRLSEWAVSGVSCAAFAIGSSHGLSPQVKQAAALRLSMSEMTFPHQLARVMLLEQLYRACCIHAGKRYHK